MFPIASKSFQIILFARYYNTSHSSPSKGVHVQDSVGRVDSANPSASPLTGSTFTLFPMILNLIFGGSPSASMTGFGIVTS